MNKKLIHVSLYRGAVIDTYSDGTTYTARIRDMNGNIRHETADYDSLQLMMDEAHDYLDMYDDRDSMREEEDE